MTKRDNKLLKVLTEHFQREDIAKEFINKIKLYEQFHAKRNVWAHFEQDPNRDKFVKKLANGDEYEPIAHTLEIANEELNNRYHFLLTNLGQKIVDEFIVPPSIIYDSMDEWPDGSNEAKLRAQLVKERMEREK